MAAKNLLAIRIFVTEAISASWLPFGHGKGIEPLLAVDYVSLRETRNMKLLISIIKSLIWIICFFAAVAIAFRSLRFLDFQPKDLLLSKGALLDHNVYLIGFYTHITLASVALVVGPIQFLAWIRQRQLILHRSLGAIYVTSCFLGGVSGVYIAFYADKGPITSFGFGALGISWLLCTTLAYQSVRKKQFAAHREWMLRSYACTFAAVTLRIWLPLLMIFGMSFERAYQLDSFLAWVPNLIVMEIYLTKTRPRPIAKHT